MIALTYVCLGAMLGGLIATGVGEDRRRRLVVVASVAMAFSVGALLRTDVVMFGVLGVAMGAMTVRLRGQLRQLARPVRVALMVWYAALMGMLMVIALRG
jgi:hypothetical protein